MPSTPSTLLDQRRLPSASAPSSRSVAAPFSTTRPPSGTSVPSLGLVIATNGGLFGMDTAALSPCPMFTPSVATTRKCVAAPPARESTSTLSVVPVRPAASDVRSPPRRGCRRRSTKAGRCRRRFPSRKSSRIVPAPQASGAAGSVMFTTGALALIATSSSVSLPWTSAIEVVASSQAIMNETSASGSGLGSPGPSWPLYSLWKLTSNGCESKTCDPFLSSIA